MTPAALTADLVVPVRADLGEGPVWDERAQRLRFLDILAGKIFAHDPLADSTRAIAVPALVGCIALETAGGLVAALDTGLWRVDPATGVRTFLVSPAEHDAAQCRFNDGKCDPQGRLWAGTMGRQSQPGAGALYCFPNASSSRRVLENVSISNGLAWTEDSATFYFIDSPTRQVDAFDFDADTGALARRRVAIELPPGRDVPDGCTLDAEGMLWIAHWGGGRVSRWDPRTGRQLAVVTVPAPHATSCTFGGAALDTLYITTARRSLSAADLASYPESGGIFAVQPGTRGRAPARFRG